MPKHGMLSAGATDTDSVPARSETYASGAPTEGGPPTEGEGPEANVTPEEQAEYEKFVNNAMLLVYDEKALPSILKRLATGAKEDPVDALATVTVHVIDRLEGSASQQGQAIDPDIVMHGGSEILEELANLAGKTGIHEFSDQEMETATYEAMDLYRSNKEQSGELDQKAVGAQFEELARADKEGRLGEMIPGIENVQQRAPAGEGRA